MEVINVTTKQELDYLYGSSALTMEGLTASEESLSEFMDYLKENTTVNRERFFVITGKMMNSAYGLTDSNAYPDDLTIVSISLEDIDSKPMIIKRFEIGARWFDDIVENNIRREAEKRSRR